MNTNIKRVPGIFLNFFHSLKKIRVPEKVIFLLVGIASTVWFLIRVIPKPTRAGYPCMKVAAPFMSSFVIYIISLGTSVFAFKRAGKSIKNARYIAATGFVVGAIVSLGIFLFQSSQKNVAGEKNVNNDFFTPNAPLGSGQGVFPGRVVWSWNPEATNEECTNTHNNDTPDGYFLPHNNNQSEIDLMFENSIISLVGEPSVDKALDKIFRHFNVQKGKGKNGYQPGETVFIKINQGTGGWMSNPGDLSMKTNNHYGVAETSPATALSLLNVLINDYGIPQPNIFIGDPIAHIFKHTYDYLYAEFPEVNYVDRGDYTHLGRYKLTKSAEPCIFYSDKGEDMPDAIEDCLYQEMENADYFINLAALKAHARSGITLTTKNNFGSHARGDATHLHPGLVAPENDNPVRTEYGMYRVFVDIMGHEKIGKNTVLFIVDGLWGGTEAVEKPVKWSMSPFNIDWPSSVFMSLDQVALESVCFDFLRNEFNHADAPGRARPLMAGVEDYLHQAADPVNWPESVTYDPENDGSPLASLGVHEHWNNPDDKQYLRNLNEERGIELNKLLGKPVVAGELTNLPEIDGNGSDNCWKDCEWIPIDNTWIGYGEEIDPADFSGQYKIAWSSKTNLLYFLVEITDDAFIDGYSYPDGGYPDYDIVEVFIDEDKSGGLHVFDDNNDMGKNSENAFSYHIVPKSAPDEGTVITEKTICDIDGTGWSNRTIPDYAEHFPEFALKQKDGKYYWEFSMKVYDDTYDHDSPEESLVELKNGKVLGLSVAYCDNDDPDQKRDNFFGSVWVPEKNYNDHWMNSDWYGVLRLHSTKSPVNTPPEIAKPISEFMIDNANVYIQVASLEEVFKDVDGDDLTFSASSDQFYALTKIENGELFVKVFPDFSGSTEVTISADDGKSLSEHVFLITRANTSIEGNSNTSKILCFPNPLISDKLNIKVSITNDKNPLEIIIYGLSGKMVKKYYLNRSARNEILTIDVSGLYPGNYIVEARCANKSWRSHKIIK